MDCWLDYEVKIVKSTYNFALLVLQFYLLSVYDFSWIVICNSWHPQIVVVCGELVLVLEV